MKETISKESEIKTDSWVSDKPLKKDFPHITHVASGKKGNNFLELHRVIMGFKSWLRGMHHQVKHLQAYLDEYSYRYNRSHIKGKILIISSGKCFICILYLSNHYDLYN